MEVTCGHPSEPDISHFQSSLLPPAHTSNRTWTEGTAHCLSNLKSFQCLKFWMPWDCKANLQSGSKSKMWQPWGQLWAPLVEAQSLSRGCYKSSPGRVTIELCVAEPRTKRSGKAETLRSCTSICSVGHGISCCCLQPTCDTSGNKQSPG